MNDRHPSGTATPPAPASDDAPAPYAPYGGQEAAYGDFTTYGDHGTTGFHTGAHSTAGFPADPLFGELPDGGRTDGGGTTGAYDTTQWSTGSHQTVHHDLYAAQHHAAYDTGAYDTTAWATGYQHLSALPQQSGSPEATGQWDTGAWLQGAPAAAPDDRTQQAADRTQQWDWGTQTFDTGAYDATLWNTGAPAADDTAPAPGDFPAQRTYDESATYEAAGTYDETGTYEETGAYEEHRPHDETRTFDRLDPYAAAPGGPDSGTERGGPADTGELPVAALLEEQEEITPVPSSRAASRGQGRSRRRPPARRSALLTVAVPSVCVVGVAGIAAASVGSFTDDGKDTAAASASEAHPVQPATANNKLDTQLQSLSAGADDFADRASRTQERIDLKAQQEADRKKAAEEAERKERLRPKFALPVAQKGLSAYFGQAGVNWMSVHTGIDFPVWYGTTVMAATDGTVRTQFNSAYGNMLILTAKDGTETWYCHLSRYQVVTGATVKAGQPIAFSGKSGNSTGPHLHFEVRPGGGAPINPLPWLRSHGLDPT
ncbi:M23 family metallopeptidase [Streptomyces sp. NPDC058319]|uniref:M23 family metallopeptidase n=1 Tax=unclassified Streptomyces TaxID=2593676 RepID=UPI0036E6C569